MPEPRPDIWGKDEFMEVGAAQQSSDIPVGIADAGEAQVEAMITADELARTATSPLPQPIVTIPVPRPRSSFQPPSSMEMPDFVLEDVAAWRQHLEAVGAVRIRGVLTPEEVERVKGLWWDWLEGLGGGATRDDPSTWTDENWPGLLYKGFCCTRGGGQNSAAWAMRGNPHVRQVFAEIWGTDDLITSFDTFICWRPWWNANKGKKPTTEGMHCDQNPHTKRGLACVQGMIMLRPVTRQIGGLCVVPGTHSNAVQAKLRELFPATQSDDWIPLQMKYPNNELNLCGQLIEASPGDLVLWDSRVLHGGYVGSGGRAEETDLARLSFAVCMTPGAILSQEAKGRRERAFAAGATTTHWPLEMKKQAGYDDGGAALPKLQDWQKSFVPMQLEACSQNLINGRG